MATIHAVLALSGLRYVVFCAQFGLLLKAYGAQAALAPGAAAVAGTFLLKSLVPSLNALADVGVRELSATHLFGLLALPILVILYRTFEPGIGTFLDSIRTPAAISALNLSLLIVAIVVPLNVGPDGFATIGPLVDGIRDTVSDGPDGLESWVTGPAGNAADEVAAILRDLVGREAGWAIAS